MRVIEESDFRITTRDLAKQLGITQRRITQICVELGIKKIGHDYHLTLKEANMIAWRPDGRRK